MTTSTSSASATGLPDRRRFLSTIAGATALGLPALPAIGGAPGPIENMHAEHVRLSRIYDAAIEKVWDAEVRCEEPERPRWHPVHDEGGHKIIKTTPGFGYAALDDSPENVAYLKKTIAREYEPDTENSGCRNKVRARRARKTLAKIEAWQKAVRRDADAAGLTLAEEAAELARVAVHQHLNEVLAIEPATFRELAFRAAILLLTADQAEEEKLLEQLIALAGIPPHHRPDGWEG